MNFLQVLPPVCNMLQVFGTAALRNQGSPWIGPGIEGRCLKPWCIVLIVDQLILGSALPVAGYTVIQPHQIFLPWKYLFFNKELKMSIYRRRIFLLFLIIFNSLMKKFKLLNGEVIFFFKYKVFIPIIGRETSSSWSRSFSALKRKRNFSYFSVILFPSL